MSIPLLIGYADYIIWLLIPVKQVKTHFYFFFLILAISSAIMIFDNFVLLFHPAYLYVGQGFFLIISLFNFKKIPNYLLFLLGVLISSVILALSLSIEIITLCLIIQHAVIFFIILKRTILYCYRENKLNLFQFVLLLYEITLVTRFMVVLHNVRTSIVYFYLTAAFGILIGIFFLFYNEVNSPKISIAGKDSINTD